MKYIEENFKKREKKSRRNYSIDDSLYIKLEEFSKIYDASVADFVNAAIEHLIKTENIVLYKKPEYEITILHAFHIRESNIAGLENLNNKYSVSINKLVNIAIRNILSD